MTSALFVPAFLFVLAGFTWSVFPRRVAQDCAEWEITQQQARSYTLMYRLWSVAFAVSGLALVVLTYAGK
jgi:hypothetical protein